MTITKEHGRKALQEYYGSTDTFKYKRLLDFLDNVLCNAEVMSWPLEPTDPSNKVAEFINMAASARQRTNTMLEIMADEARQNRQREGNWSIAPSWEHAYQACKAAIHWVMGWSSTDAVSKDD